MKYFIDLNRVVAQGYEHTDAADWMSDYTGNPIEGNFESDFHTGDAMYLLTPFGGEDYIDYNQSSNGGEDITDKFLEYKKKPKSYAIDLRKVKDREKAVKWLEDKTGEECGARHIKHAWVVSNFCGERRIAGNEDSNIPSIKTRTDATDEYLNYEKEKGKPKMFKDARDKERLKYHVDPRRLKEVGITAREVAEALNLDLGDAEQSAYSRGWWYSTDHRLQGNHREMERVLKGEDITDGIIEHLRGSSADKFPRQSMYLKKEVFALDSKLTRGQFLHKYTKNGESKGFPRGTKGAVYTSDEGTWIPVRTNRVKPEMDKTQEFIEWFNNRGSAPAQSTQPTPTKGFKVGDKIKLRNGDEFDIVLVEGSNGEYSITTKTARVGFEGVENVKFYHNASGSIIGFEEVQNPGDIILN